MTINSYAKLLAGVGALGLLTACSNDIVTPAPDAGESRTAMMTINLRDVNSGMGSRAEGDEAVNKDPYADGEAAEYQIKSARFFFYDASGTYMCEASAWNGGTMDESQNITLNGNTVVVLEGLKKDAANPKYMLTVLNGDGFNHEYLPLPEAAKKLYNWENEQNVANATDEVTGRFVMTTSSYFDGGSTPTGNHDDTYYYATVLEDSNFIEGGPDLGNNAYDQENLPKAVNVYVERLAAKVELDWSKLGNFITVDGRKLYKVNATVGGTGNDEGDENEGVKDVYVEILGWDLNATSKASYFSKNLDEFSLNTTSLWDNWNNAGFHRSFWGKGIGYGENPNTTTAPYDLNYINFYDGNEDNTPVVNQASVRYANEYTNTPDIFANAQGQIIPSKVSHVILKARVCDKNGNALNMVRGANGVYFLVENFENEGGLRKGGYLSYVLGHANTVNNLNIWYLVEAKGETKTETLEDGSTKITYTKESVFNQVDASMVKLAKSGLGTGRVKVVPNLPETRNDVTMVYAYRNADGTFTTFADLDAATAALETALSVGENNGKAMAYTGGASYYTIPIEHEITVGKTASGIFKEGYYGLVRNHWYKLTINKLVTVGSGLFEPGTGTETDQGEEIIPNDPEDPNMHVLANLKVLTWKIVNQNVELE